MADEGPLTVAERNLLAATAALFALRGMPEQSRLITRCLGRLKRFDDEMRAVDDAARLARRKPGPDAL